MIDHGLSTTNAYSQVCGLEWLGCHAGYQEVSRCRTRGESEVSNALRQQSTQAREYTLALKPRADITRSPKQGYQLPKNGLISYKNIY